MIITFCGHSAFDKKEKNFKLYEILCKSTDGKPVDFYIGGYGLFDEYSLEIALEYKQKHDNAKIFFITPYIDKSYIKLEYYKKIVDGIIFPELENVPKKFAILKRNEWMIEKADLVVAYVKFSWGGARKGYEYAKKRKKKIINLASKI